MHENTIIRDRGFKYVNFSLKSSSSECMEWIAILCFAWNEKRSTIRVNGCRISLYKYVVSLVFEVLRHNHV